MSNSYTKTYQDGDPLLESDLDSGFGSVQPSISNLALATTGSTSQDLLQSAGSNTPPAFVTPDTVAATFTSTGANAIFANIIATSSVSVCDAIISAVQTSVVNATIDRITSCSATAANLIATSMTSAGADAIGSTMASASSANNIGQIMGQTGANYIGMSMSAASSANNIGTLMTATGADSIGYQLTANSAANNIAHHMTSTGANDILSVVSAASCADNVLKVSNIGSLTTSTDVNTSSVIVGGYNAYDSMSVPNNGLYLFYAQATILFTSSGSVGIYINSSGSGGQLSSIVNVYGSGGHKSTGTVIAIASVTTSDTITLQASAITGAGNFTNDYRLQAVRIHPS